VVFSLLYRRKRSRPFSLRENIGIVSKVFSLLLKEKEQRSLHSGKIFLYFRQWFLCSRRKRSRAVFTQGKYLYISDRGSSALEGKGVVFTKGKHLYYF
jgi:hypothetical protein